jgi:hypothetical protein
MAGSKILVSVIGSFEDLNLFETRSLPALTRCHLAALPSMSLTRSLHSDFELRISILHGGFAG